MYICLSLTRMTFTFKYLIKKNPDTRFGIIRFCDLFWDKNNKLKRRNLIALLVVLNLLSFVNIFGYDLAINKLYHSIWDCTIWRLTFLILCYLISLILYMTFAFQFVRYKIKDQIWMSLEFIAFTFTSVLSGVVFAIINRGFDYNNVKVQAWVSIFFNLYFPLIAHYRHTLKLKRSNSKQSIENERIMELCRQFYCEENGIFLESFEKYNLKLVTGDYLITMFIEDGAPFELNISFDLKHKVMDSAVDFQRDLYLKEVHAEIKLLVQQNILPYIHNDSSP